MANLQLELADSYAMNSNLSGISSFGVAATRGIMCAAVVFLAANSLVIADENQPANPLDEAKVRFFESRVRPVLVEHCYECHSAGAKSLEGELKLDTRAGWQAGGVSGPSIVPGDPKASLLAKAIRFDDKDLQMPPAGKLSDEVIADIEKWIADGAVDPREGVAKTEEKSEKNRREANQRWAFTKPIDPPVPQVSNAAWPANDVDRFILSKLEGAGLAPVSDADKRTWIRRATFDLIGLPPTPEEVEAFVGDTSPQAYAKVVDRLLESRQYGERWGRYWLDVARYADTAGDNSDFPIPQMYKYRNWVIDAFNRDMPYDEFIRQQLAGDLLPSANIEEHRQKLLGTGYLANARRFGSRVDDYPMHLTIEDTIDNLGRAFLGLSLNCARCHDHKFDPVSTEDYYALYGFFASTRYPWPGIELEQRQRDLVPLVNDDVVARVKQEREAKQKELDEEVKRLEKLRDAAKDDARKELDKQVGAARSKAEQHGKSSPGYELAYAVADMPTKTNAKVQYKGDPNKTGPEVPRRFVTALGGQALPTGDSSSGRLHLANAIASADNPLTARVMVNRIWQHHFGRGLVPTSNDFGKQGRGATHPELLDWLAHRFVDSDWSIKSMHRLMMLSRTYRLAALDDAERLAKDPSNDLLSGFRRKRLDAEAIRDTLLLLGGTLDPEPGQAHPFPPQHEWNFTQHNPFKAFYPTNKRSVYIMTQRIQRDPYLAIFDGADPSASTAVRTSTTTTLQSLYLLNNPLVHEQAAKIAERLRNDAQDDAQRVNLAYQRLFARMPTDEERATGVEFVSQGDSKQAWESYVRALLRLNEFVYVD